MKITLPPTQINVQFASGEPPLQTFLQTHYLQFKTGLATGNLRRVVIDPAKTSLKGRFLPYEYDARSTGNPSLFGQFTTLSGSPAGVIVELPAPRHVLRMALSYGTGFSAADTFELYRLDGDTPAEKPSASLPLSDYTVEEVYYVAMAMPRNAPRAVISGGETRVTAEPAEAALAAAQHPHAERLLPAIDFVDRRFAIRRVHAGGLAALAPGDIDGLVVGSYPTSPRLGLAEPGALEKAVNFWQAPGEIGAATPLSQGVVNLPPTGGQHAFAQALERHVNAVLERQLEQSGPPEVIDVVLVIGTDAPCRWTLDELEIEYYLEMEAMPDEKEKVSLRFPGRKHETQACLVSLPRGVAIHLAELKTQPSFGGESWVDATVETLSGAEALGLTAELSIDISEERWAAQSLELPGAMLVSSLSLGLMSLAAGTELSAALHADWQGSPQGEALAKATLRLETQNVKPGAPEWMTVKINPPAAVNAGAYWITVKASRGRLAWLVNPNPASFNARLAILQRIADGQNMEQNIFKGYEAFYRLASPLGAPVGDQEAAGSPPVTLRLTAPAPAGEEGGGRAVEASAQAQAGPGAPLFYDLKAALTAYLASLPANAETAQVALAFASGLPGSITVYPAKITLG